MNPDEIAESVLKTVFAIAVLIGGAYAVGNYPDLLVPAGAGWIVWAVCKLVWNENARGIIEDLLGLLAVGAICCAIYGYAIGSSDLAKYAAAGVLGVGVLVLIHNEIVKRLGARRQSRSRS